MTDRFIGQARRVLNPRQGNRDPLNELRIRLVHKKNTGDAERGGPKQRAFLDAVVENRFLDYLREKGVELDFRQARDEPLASPLPRPLSEAEFINPPLSTAYTIRDWYRHLGPAAAASVAVWNVITLHNLAEGRLRASFLAANTNRVSGKARIESALRAIRNPRTTRGEEVSAEAQKVDDNVRTVFRSMGGLHHIRGSPSVFIDCNLSRVWWQGHFIEQARKELPRLKEETAWETFGARWTPLAEFAVRRLTILAAPPMMSGLVAHLHDWPLRTGKEMERLLRRIGMEFSTIDLHAWSADEVCLKLGRLRENLEDGA